MGRGVPMRPTDTLALYETSRSSPKTYPTASESSSSFTSSSLASEIPPADSSKLTDLSEIDESRHPLPVWGGARSISIRPDFIGVAGTAEDHLAIFVFLLVFFSSSSPTLVRVAPKQTKQHTIGHTSPRSRHQLSCRITTKFSVPYRNEPYQQHSPFPERSVELCWDKAEDQIRSLTPGWTMPLCAVG
ncbi:unnamed protein product [Phytophthora fragariaefolia]|uniref:Unnamed protein product n=1 Tax=Phytophthora fragariaefolia TaxID=1490495 RepID=A0A9W6UB68_9STRA|nr:unnamed protein product [Phytophthora fragariaefolia]